MVRTLVVLLCLCGSVLQAQQSLVGSWQVSYTAGMRMENGEATPIVGTGVLTIAVTGDSLIGTLVPDPLPDLPSRPPTRMAAKSGLGAVDFVSRRMAKMNSNGHEPEVMATSTWSLQAAGDSINGTVVTSIEGFSMGMQEPQPVTGTRKKG
jgi:hypothetical protein